MKVYRAIVSDWNGDRNHDLGVFATREAARTAVDCFGIPYNREHWERCVHEEEVWTDGSAFCEAKKAKDRKEHEDYLKAVKADKARVAKKQAEEKARAAFQADKRAAFEKALAAQWAATK